MGQQAQNGGRRASLDQQKRRAAGRRKDTSPEREAIKDAAGQSKRHGQVGGAFGAEGKANRRGSSPAGEGGGGGGADTRSRVADVGRNSRPARTRGATGGPPGR